MAALFYKLGELEATSFIEIYEEIRDKLVGGLLPTISIDFFCKAIIDSACNIEEGFGDLMEKENYLAAIPLIRMQLDNAIVAFAGLEAKNDFEFMLHFVQGKPINQIKNHNGEQMTNKVLIEGMDKVLKSINGTTVSSLYKKGCSYVHPSVSAFKASWFDASENTLKYKSWKDVKPWEYSEGDIVTDMLCANLFLMQILLKWVSVKQKNDYIYQKLQSGEPLPEGLDINTDLPSMEDANKMLDILKHKGWKDEGVPRINEDTNQNTD